MIKLSKQTELTFLFNFFEIDTENALKHVIYNIEVKLPKQSGKVIRCKKSSILILYSFIRQYEMC